MSKSFFKRINKEIQLYGNDNFILPNLIVKPSDDLNIWYFIFYNLKDTDFDNGVYLGKILLPNNYPFAPPDFEMLTPSGRFQINKKLCTSFSGFHKELYSPGLNIAGMLQGLLSFMTDPINREESKGIGGIFDTTKEDKIKMANNSIKYNLNNNKDIFEKYFKTYYQELNINELNIN